jgi:streptogramin lyase
MSSYLSPGRLALCLFAAAGCSADGNVGDDIFTTGMSATMSGGGTDSASSASGGSGSATAGSATSGGPGTSAGTGSSGDIKFDVPPGGTATAGDDGGTCACGNTDWSYVFVANSGESTVSKINTRTLQEEGRYLTRPDGAGNPSRTSVSVDGKAVVVANRHTGIVKIWTRPEFCAGANTSTGKNDVKAWGTDDCVAWYTEFSGKTVQRPVAWTTGQLNPATCQFENQKVWTTTGAMGSGPGQCGQSGVWVHRLNGDTGVVEDEIHLPEAEFNCDHTNTTLGLGLGPYGGAVDNEGNFWFHGWGNGKLVRVDFDTLDHEIFSGGGYGITVDTKGRVWLSSSISRFDYATKQSASANTSTSGGIAQDLQGRIWAAGNNGVVWVDMETMAIGDSVALPYNGQVKGVSVDIDGYIWAVFQGDTHAFKIDPNTYSYESYDGLTNPYTYSDMTGGQISNVNCNPPQG